MASAKISALTEDTSPALTDLLVSVEDPGGTPFTRKILVSKLLDLGRSYKNNIGASSAPTANDDSGDGYDVGSLWVDTANDLVYFCVDATATAAIWSLVSNYALSVNLGGDQGVSATAFTPTDVNGVSHSLAAGRWVLLGRAIFENPGSVSAAAITDSGNNVQSTARVSSGTTDTVDVMAYVTPAATTTYKLRVAADASYTVKVHDSLFGGTGTGLIAIRLG
jgi:hypothetical protein